MAKKKVEKSSWEIDLEKTIQYLNELLTVKRSKIEAEQHKIEEMIFTLENEIDISSLKDEE